jgi:endonuclease-3
MSFDVEGLSYAPIIIQTTLTGKRMQPSAIEGFFATLKTANPSPVTELEYTSVFELLSAVLLSAQATDVSVNKATRRLFPVANTPRAMLDLGQAGLENYIRTIGLFRSKARHLLQTCQILIDQHGGVFGEATMAVDTHLFRLANRTGLAPGKTPYEVELKLLERIPGAYLVHAHHWLILHGRYICQARKPLCWQCAVRPYCDFKER